MYVVYMDTQRGKQHARARTRKQVAREKLVSLGLCIGKFTHSNKFRLTVGATELLAQYAKYKVCGDVRLCTPAVSRSACMCAHVLPHETCTYNRHMRAHATL